MLHHHEAFKNLVSHWPMRRWHWQVIFLKWNSYHLPWLGLKQKIRSLKYLNIFFNLQILIGSLSQIRIAIRIDCKLHNRLSRLGYFWWCDILITECFMRSSTYWPLWGPPIILLQGKFFTVKLLKSSLKLTEIKKQLKIIFNLIRGNNSVYWHFGFRLCVWWIFELINFLNFRENAVFILKFQSKESKEKQH